MTALEFVEDMMRMQNEYISMRASGFYQRKKEIRILDNAMQKYGMTYDEAEQAARGRLTMQEYYRILMKKEEHEKGEKSNTD